MKDSLGIGSAVREILSSDAAVAVPTGGCIYPLVAEENATFPFIIYGILDVHPKTTKDGHYAFGDEAEVGISILAESYEECVDLSIAVRHAMVSFSGGTDDYDISSISFAGASDDYKDGAYFRNMIFTIDIE